MRITGRGIWGQPRDPEEAKRVLREAVSLGINLIDTAASYGPAVSEDLIREALAPYPEGLVIATKAGFSRPGPYQWSPDGDPQRLRESCEGSLRRLGLERIDLMQLHTVDPDVPFEESVGELARLREEGKVRHVGLCNVTVEQLEAGRRIAPVVSVQNRYGLRARESESVVDACERHELAFLPWAPLAAGRVMRRYGSLRRIWAAAEGAHRRGTLKRVAKAHRATPFQVALAWLLRRSPIVVPIPGTGSVSHLRENVAAAELRLSDEQFAALRP